MVTDIRALGIDVGSTTVKIVGVDAAGNLERHRLEIGGKLRWKSVGNRLTALAQLDSSSFHLIEPPILNRRRAGNRCWLNDGKNRWRG